MSCPSCGQMCDDSYHSSRRVRDLEAALRLWPHDGSVHEQGCLGVDSPDDCDCFTSIARAALAPAEEHAP